MTRDHIHFARCDLAKCHLKGSGVYLDAVEDVFGADVDYAQSVKLYGESPEAEKRCAIS